MRAYSALDEETLRTRSLLKEWTDDEILSDAQQGQLEEETVSGLRTTNIFLRGILFLFTLIGVAGVTGLFFLVFLTRPTEEVTGVWLLLFAVACYAGAEGAVAQARLYRYGIEEALALCSIGFLCAGLATLLPHGGVFAPQTFGIPVMVPVAGIAASLWVWYRFNLWYAFIAAMILGCLLPGYWESSHAEQLMILAGIYTAGLAVVVRVRLRHRYDFLEAAYSLAEAFLWLGIYLSINLKISALDLPAHWWTGSAAFFAAYPRPFYWMTWVLIWCVPPVILVRGIRLKERMIMATGAVTLMLTLATNKPYLGWQRHTWDPMVLGVALVGTAWLIRRWLAQGTEGVRGGFTASRLSAKDERWLGYGSSALGLVTPHAITPAAQPQSAEFKFGGGSSGGGGASGDF